MMLVSPRESVKVEMDAQSRMDSQEQYKVLADTSPKAVHMLRSRVDESLCSHL